MLRRSNVVLVVVGAAAVLVIAWPGETSEFTDQLPCDEMALEVASGLQPEAVGAVFDQIDDLPGVGGFDGEGTRQIVWVLPETEPAEIAELAAALEAIDGVEWVKRGTRVDGEYAEPPRCVIEATARGANVDDP